MKKEDLRDDDYNIKVLKKNTKFVRNEIINNRKYKIVKIIAEEHPFYNTIGKIVKESGSLIKNITKYRIQPDIYKPR